MQLRFLPKTMDVIMYIVREFKCEPAQAIDMLVENPDLIEEAKYAQKSNKKPAKTCKKISKK